MWRPLYTERVGSYRLNAQTLTTGSFAEHCRELRVARAAMLSTEQAGTERCTRDQVARIGLQRSKSQSASRRISAQSFINSLGCSRSSYFVTSLVGFRYDVAPHERQQWRTILRAAQTGKQAIFRTGSHYLIS
jgi:hypothetical protein